MLSVLYVDDEPGLLELAKLFLERDTEFHVDIASSASDGLALLRTTEYDAIISDYLMPIMDGISFLKQVREGTFACRQNPQKERDSPDIPGPGKTPRDVPFILFTGKGREEVVIEAINSGVDFYIQKGGHPGAQFVELGHKVRQAVARWRAELSLIEREALLSSIFRAAPIGIGLVSDRVLLRVNDRICTITGYTEKELLGKSARVFYPSDEDFEFVGREKYNEIRRLGTGTVETRWQRKDGTIIDIILSSTPLDPSDHTKGVTFTALDITERKRAEDALQEKTKELEQFFLTTLDLFCIANTDGYFLRLNPEWAKTLGYTLAELEGHRFLDFVHPDDLDATLATVSQLAGQQEVLNFTNRYRHRDGTWRWIEWRSRPQGKLIFAAARDITGRMEPGKKDPALSGSR